ncbi:8802_t:CDS:2, partial [Scutellospora calospora]
LLSDVLALLAPFYKVTKMLLSIMYATLNIVCYTMHYFKKTIALSKDEDNKYYTNLLNNELDEVASQDEDTNNKVITTIDKLNELYRIEQATIIEESNDNLYISSSELLVINEPSNTSTNQVNYFLLRIYEDSDNKSSIFNKVVQYLALLK